MITEQNQTVISPFVRIAFAKADSQAIPGNVTWTVWLGAAVRHHNGGEVVS